MMRFADLSIVADPSIAEDLSIAADPSIAVDLSIVGDPSIIAVAKITLFLDPASQITDIDTAEADNCPDLVKGSSEEVLDFTGKFVLLNRFLLICR